jgi:hypothetical protein
MDGNPGGAAPADRPEPAAHRWRPADRVRACDADREAVISQLSERYAEGRLSRDTLDQRLEAALQARYQHDLGDVLADLPSRRRLGPAVQAYWQRGRATLAGLMAGASRPASARLLAFPSGGQRRFTIGRDADCDMVLPDPTISRRHAGLRREASGWMLDDLGSTNGTRLNGWRVRAWVPVRDGDLVSFGAATFVFGAPPGGHGSLAAERGARG